MAAPNGDIKVETAESFARDYLDDLFNNNKNLGAFEEETLDINIKSKYDDIEVEEESTPKPDSNTAQFTVESTQVESAEAPLEPGNETFQVNGHADSILTEVVSHNGDLHSEVIEPGQSEFAEQVTDPPQEQFAAVSEPEFISQVIEPDQSDFVAQVAEQVSQLDVVEPSPPNGSHFESELPEEIAEEENEQEDIVAPIPTSRSKSVEATDEEIAQDLQFKKLGLSKNWWDSKRTESETQKDSSQPVDKFRTIKQNIKRGNTRSLLARFENMSKLTE